MSGVINSMPSLRRLSRGVLDTNPTPTFTTIPLPAGNFHKFFISVEGVTAAAHYTAYARFNADSSGNYDLAECIADNGASPATTNHGASLATAHALMGLFGYGVDKAVPASFELELRDPKDTTGHKRVHHRSVLRASTGTTFVTMGGGIYRNTAAMTQAHILLYSGFGTGSPGGVLVAPTAGKWTLYGLAN